MDKNKSRTDLLAAGRKKLQQFRQKKDTKGSTSQGKASKKSTKSEQHESDADVTSSNAKASSMQWPPEEETVTPVGPSSGDSLISPLAEESVAPDVDIAAINTLSTPIMQETSISGTLLAHSAETCNFEAGFENNFIDYTALDPGEIAITNNDEVAGVACSVISVVPDCEGEPKLFDAVVAVDVSASSPKFDTTDHTVDAVETQPMNREEEKDSLPLQEDTPDKSLIPSRSDQGTDGFGSEHSARSSGLELEGGRRFDVSELAEVAETAAAEVSVQTVLDEASSEFFRSEGADRVSKSASAPHVSDELALGFSVSNVGGTSDVIHDVTNQPGEVGNVDQSNADKSKMLSSSSLRGNDSEEGGQADRMVLKASDQHSVLEQSSVLVSKSHMRPLLTELVNSSESSSGVLPLMEVINGLSQDEYRLLLSSRSFVHSTDLGTGNWISQQGFLGSFERIKEELFLRTCINCMLDLQLAEYFELQKEHDFKVTELEGEMSLLSVSLKEACERNDHLATDLTACRSELQSSVSGSEELQHQLHAAKAEVEEVSVKTYELQNSLEGSRLDFLNVSKELADCKNIMAVLRLENDNLKGTVTSLDEERTKLVEEKDFCLHENEKLTTELADLKEMVESLRLENANLGRTLVSLTEHSKKLEGEKEPLATGNEKLSLELSDCKALVEALQTEIANSSRNLTLVIEEREKLEEGQKHSVLENERLCSELLVLHNRLSKDHDLCMRLEAELKETTLCLEQLTEENIFLSSSLDIHKAKIREIEERQADFSSPVIHTADQGEEGAEVQSRDGANVTDDECLQKISGVRGTDASISVVEKFKSQNLSGGLQHGLVEQEMFDDSHGFIFLKRCLEEAEEILQNLEKAVREMHSHSATSSSAGSKSEAPAVSKLIQAFELQMHHEPESENKAVTGERSTVSDPCALAQECAGTLKAVLKQLAMGAENASSAFKAEQYGRSTADHTIKELNAELDALKVHIDYLEATSIELGVLYEAVMQNLSCAQERNSELQILHEQLKQQESSLRAENCTLDKMLAKRDSRIKELQSQLHDLQQSSEETASMLLSQVENSQKEATERTSRIEQRWNSLVSQIVEAVEKLDGSVGSTVSDGSTGSLDIGNHLGASVDAAIESIYVLKDKLEAAQTEHESTFSLFKELNEKCNGLLEKNELANGTLRNLFNGLTKLVSDSGVSLEETECNLQDEQLPFPADYSRYKTLMGQLESLLADRVELQSLNNKLNLELSSRTKDIEDLNRRCVTLSSIQKLVADIEGVVKLEFTSVDNDGMPLSRLESMVSLLLCKYQEFDEQVHTSREEFGSKFGELEKLQEMVQQLADMKRKHENEILLLKDSVNQTEETLAAVRSELQEKVSELEQSEQRVSSIREKLSIAVSKGKGLVVQRDNLKQSLVETSSELEECSQELQLKDAKLQEIEAKLKTYAEAGERVEALESELSYIRNSATALRESFLLKDSVLQRIEEILEDLDLPEHFHSRGIIEKVDWLARSVTGNSLPPADLDQKSSAGEPYPDTGFVVMDAWKEDAQPSPNLGDDLRRRYEELQNKFYGLAEQNEMLEQSLMERNYLVQRWEELLNTINMPAHLQSLEPEDRIEWLRNALSEANHDRNFLQQKNDKLENYCGSLSADFEESQTRISYLTGELDEYQQRISDLEMNLQAVVHARENLSERLEILTCDNEKLSTKIVQFELDKEILQNEVMVLEEKLAENMGNEKRIQLIDGEIIKLQELVCDALNDPGSKDLISGGSSTECLEGLLRKLIESYRTPFGKAVLVDAVEENQCRNANGDSVEGKTNIQESDLPLLKRETVDVEEPNSGVLKKELEDALSELMFVRDERDKCIEKQQSLVCEVETLDENRRELQELLSQEEQKSSSLREKLNVAVRKGKSLVQQRDSLKQTIQEMSSELEHLRTEIKQRESALEGYEQKMRDLTTYSGRVEALESESLHSRNRLAETEHLLQEKEQTLTMILTTLGEIDTNGEIYNCDPIEKLQLIGKQFQDLQAAMFSSEQESIKSRRAAELLLAELNEVQDRNDSLQEELAKATVELRELTSKRDVAEGAKLEALSRLEKLSTVCLEEKRNQNSDLMELTSAISQLRTSFSEITDFLISLLSKDVEFLENLKAGMESCLRRTEGNHVVDVPPFGMPDGISLRNLDDKGNFLSMDFWSEIKKPDHLHDKVFRDIFSSAQELMNEMAALKVKLHEQSATLHEEYINLSKLFEGFDREFEALQKDYCRAESIGKEREREIVALHRNISVLHEACTFSLMEIENRKALVVGSSLAPADPGMNMKLARFTDAELSSSGESNLSSEEHIKDMAKRLLSGLKDFATFKGEILEGNQKEMKKTISNLQKELQEKDIQRERICMELVSQIKEAEAVITRHSRDLESSKVHGHDLEKRIEELEKERGMLVEKVKELQDGHAMSMKLKERIKSLTHMLAAKDQEIESLIQALDEEEVQMEDLKNKIKEVEKLLEERNSDVEILEASRGKVLKKLSITVGKFDELHHFSESLIVEVEKLQSQLHDRDAEISFLRQEVTRCTNDVLATSQMNSKKNSDEIIELLIWLGTMISGEKMHDLNVEDNSQINVCKENLQKKITSTLSELEDLRAVAQSKDALLEIERRKVQELTLREETLEKSLREKESQLDMLEGVEDSDRLNSGTSEIIEVEPVVNKWTVPGPSTTSQVRSLRKVNNDQVAIAIDMDPSSSSRVEYEDEDKVHGFKSLTTSKIVPKFTRPVTDMIDGLWVSCDRALMRQPALRLLIMIYWAVLHALVAAFVV